MRHLIGAEARRWIARRGLWMTFLGALAIVGLICLSLFFATKPPSGADVARGQQYFQEAHAHWEKNGAADRQACLESVPESEKAMCDMPEPKASDYIPQPMVWKDASQVASQTAAVVGGLFSLLMAASFVGGEYRHGTLSTWLTFVPSRSRVWSAKMIVAMLASAAVTAVTIAVTLAGMAAGILINQGQAGLGAWDVALGIAARGVGFGGMMGLLGAGLAVLFRNTIAAVGIPLAYLFAQGLVGILSVIPGYHTIVPFLPENNVRAYLENGATIQVMVPKVTDRGLEMDMLEKVIPFAQGLTYLLILVGAVALASVVLFQRRDVND